MASATPSGLELEAAVNLLNAALGADGNTIDRTRISRQSGGQYGQLKQLLADIEASKVQVLIIAGTNPGYSAPPELKFAETIKKVPTIMTTADMALKIDAAALLVFRAAWVKDVQGARVTREAAMAKLYATEAAQEVIDQAVQIFGGTGVVSGVPVERLYREIRALRIYEGTSEIQKLIIAGEALKAAGG